MPVRAIGPLALCLAAAFALVSCSAGTVPAAGQDEDGQQGPAQVQFAELHWTGSVEGESLTGARLNLDDAVDTEIGDLMTAEYTTKALNTKDRSFGAFDISSKGVLFGSVNPSPQKLTKDKTFDGSKVSFHSVAATVEAGKLTAFPSTQNVLSKDGPRQITVGVSEEGKYVWSETAETSGGETAWRVFTGGKDQKPRLLGQAEDFFAQDGVGLFPMEGQMALKESVAYWESMVVPDDVESAAAILSADLDDGQEAREFMENSIAPVALDSWVASVGVYPEEDPTVQQRQINLHDEVEDGPGRGRVLVVDEGAGTEGEVPFSRFAGAGSTLMTTYARNLLVMDIDNTLIAAIENPDERGPVGMAVCGGYATWTYEDDGYAGDKAQYFLDLKTKELYRVANENLLGQTFCAGDYFAWSVLEEGDSNAAAYTEVMKWKPSAS